MNSRGGVFLEEINCTLAMLYQIVLGPQIQTFISLMLPFNLAQGLRKFTL